MNSLTNIRKIRVFISSMCDGRYTIVRKAIKELLLSTGLIEWAYVFEDEPAGSNPLEEDYLGILDEANLCIFLIDNKDGVSPAVQKEIDRAKQNDRIRRLYIFCTETQKEKTALQEELIQNSTVKYYEVDQFSDIVKKAYVSVIQDILTCYKLRGVEKSNLNRRDADFESSESAVHQNSTDGTKLSYSNVSINNNIKDILNRLGKTETELLHIASLKQLHGTQDSCNLDEKLASFLNIVFFNSKFNEFEYESLTEAILELQPKMLHKILQLRFCAIKYYFTGQYGDAIKTLQETLQKAIQNKDIPEWFILDIALDLRYTSFTRDNFKNEFRFSNDGEIFIGKSTEILHYPLIDRYVKEFYKATIDFYRYIYYKTPGSLCMSGPANLFPYIAKIYSIAMLNGSLAYVTMTRNYMAYLLFTLMELYPNDSHVKFELIRESICIRDEKTLDIIKRKNGLEMESINFKDSNMIWKSVNNIELTPYKTAAKFIALKYLGNYFDDKSFDDCLKELIQHIKELVHDDNRPFFMENRIFEFLQNNYNRIPSNTIADIIFLVLDHHVQCWYDSAVDLLYFLDYSTLSTSYQEKLLSLFIDIVKNPKNYIKLTSTMNRVKHAIINFSQSTKEDIKELEEALQKYMEEYYREDYLFETISDESEDNLNFVKLYLENTRKVIQESQKASILINIINDNSLFRISYILNHVSSSIRDKILDQLGNKIVDVLFDVLESAQVTSQVKIYAIMVFMLLQQHKDMNRFLDRLLKNRTKYTNARSFGNFAMFENSSLTVVFELLLLLLGKGNENCIIEFLWAIDVDNVDRTLETLRTLNEFFDIFPKDKFSPNLISIFINFFIIKSSCLEKEIQIYSIRCLIKLLRFGIYKSKIVTQLSRMMNRLNFISKIEIIRCLKTMDIPDDKYKEYIVQKATVDNNYLVRLEVVD